MNIVWKLLVAATLGLVGLVVAGPGAQAGGWAVSTLDPLGSFQAGTPTEVGFTIRQHGVTPVDLESTGITIRDTSGKEQFFAGQRTGAVGHYVAMVTFPTAGAYTWSLQQGWFEAQALGAVTIGAPAPPVAPAPSTSRSVYSWPVGLRAALPIGAVALALVAVLAGRRSNGGRRAAVTP